jgi:predicted phosphodiesterase
MSVETFTVLQLTDLHLTNRKSHDKEQEIVISALLADIEVMTQAGLKPDLVLFTGDLVNDADEKDITLDAVEKFLAPLLQKVRLNGDRLIIVPGNHDLSRDVVQSRGADHREFYTKYGTAAANAWYRSGYPELQKLKFDAFLDAGKYTDAPLLDLAVGYTLVELPAFDSVFCMWNTAASSAGGLPDVDKDDYGKLVVPEYQVIDMCAAVAASSCTRKFLVSHHPLSWLKEEIRNSVSGILTATFDGIFAGHIHKSAPYQIATTEGDTIHFQTGALYQGRDRWNGYTIVRIAPSENAYEVHARRFSKEAGKFVAAVEVANDGIYHPPGPSKTYWKNRPAVDRPKWSSWVDETLRPSFVAKHGETLVGRSIHEVFYEHPMQSRLPDFETASAKSASEEPDVSFGVVLEATENYVVFGESNFGKSTFLKRLGLALIERATDPSLLTIPVLIEFSTIARTGDAVGKAIRASLPSLGVEGALRELLLDGLVTLLVDDVDPSDHVRMDSLSDFIRSFPRCRYIFTSRSTEGIAVGLVAKFDGAVSFREVVLRPLRIKGIRGFTELYCAESGTAECSRLSEQVISVLKQNSLPATAFSVSVLIEVMNSLKGEIIIDHVTLIERFVEYLLAKGKAAETRRGSFDFNDKTDCLSYIAERMARTGEYELSYDAMHDVVKDYIDDLGLPFIEKEIVAEFERHKIIKRNELGHFRFYLRAFLEFFIAERMRKDGAFKAWVLDESRYLSFVHEIEFYCGLNRNDAGLLDTIAERHAVILEGVRAEVKSIDPRGFDHVALPADKGSGEKAVDDLREQLSAPALTRDEKDEMIDAELVVSEGAQGAFRPVPENFAAQHYLSLTLYSSALRSLAQVNRAAKERHMATLFESWVEYLGHSFGIIPAIVKHRALKMNGVEYRVFARSAISDEKLTRMLMLYLPTGVAAMIRSYMGNEKMVLQVEFDVNDDRPTIEKIMRTFLLADLDVSDWIGVVNKLKEVLADKSYLSGVLIWKLNSIFKMREPPREKAERIAEIIARMHADQYGGDADKRQKLYASRLLELRKMITLRDLKPVKAVRTEAQLAISSDLRNVTDSSS